MKSGTCTVAPVTILAFLVTFVAVSPFTPGSLSVICTVMCGGSEAALAAWLRDDAGLCEAAAEQAAAYLADGWRTLGAIPSQDTLVR